MPACIIKSCQRTSRGKKTDKPRFHVFPPVKSPKFLLWLKSIGISASEFSFVPSWRRYICSNHFTDDSYKWHLLNIPLENRKLREDAVPNLLLLNVDKDAESRSVESDESSSESEYTTEFESESEYESEYDSLSTSEFSFDINEDVAVAKAVKTDESIGVGHSNVDLLRKDKAERLVFSTASADTSPSNWTFCRYPHEKGCWSKIRGVVTQSDDKLCLLDKREAVRFSQVSIQSIKQDHRYTLQQKVTYFQSQVSRKDLENASGEGECQTTSCGNSEECSISPKTASDQDSMCEPGSDVDSIESLDIDADESIDGKINNDDYAPTKECLVFLNETGEFLDSSIIVEEPIRDNADNYSTSSDSKDNKAIFNKNFAMDDESMDLQEIHKQPFARNDSFFIKQEFNESSRDAGHNMSFNKIDVGSSTACEFGEHLSFNASNLVNIKMEVHEDDNCSGDSGVPVGRDESIIPDEESEFSRICVKREPIDPVNTDDCNISLNENRCVVYESCLRELLKRCQQCGALVVNPLFNYHGSLLTVTLICMDGHKILWKSRPEIPF